MEFVAAGPRTAARSIKQGTAVTLMASEASLLRALLQELIEGPAPVVAGDGAAPGASGGGGHSAAAAAALSSQSGSGGRGGGGGGGGGGDGAARALSKAARVAAVGRRARRRAVTPKPGETLFYLGSYSPWLLCERCVMWCLVVHVGGTCSSLQRAVEADPSERTSVADLGQFLATLGSPPLPAFLLVPIEVVS